MSTLSGATLEWFVSLPDGHITTFDQFATLFKEQYLVNKAPTRLSYDVFLCQTVAGGVCEGQPEQVRSPSGEAETH